MGVDGVRNVGSRWNPGVDTADTKVHVPGICQGKAQYVGWVFHWHPFRYSADTSGQTNVTSLSYVHFMHFAQRVGE
jgi:hypothetical protein